MDGNTDGNFANNSVTHTQEQDNAWWQIDLGTHHSLQNIESWDLDRIVARWRLKISMYWFRIVPLKSTDLSATLTQQGVRGYYVSGNAVVPNADVQINQTGQYIRIQLTGRDALSLAEVEIIGSPNQPVN